MTQSKHNPHEQLSAYLDGELPPKEMAKLESLLAADPALRAELEELAEVKRQVGSLPRVPAPASVRLAVREQLERGMLLAESPARRPNPWLALARWTAAAAMLLITAALGVAVYQHVRMTPDPQPEHPTMTARRFARDKDVAAAPERPEPANELVTGKADNVREAPSARPHGEAYAGKLSAREERDGRALSATSPAPAPVTPPLAKAPSGHVHDRHAAAKVSAEQVVVNVSADNADQQAELTRQLSGFLAYNGAMMMSDLPDDLQKNLVDQQRLGLEASLNRNVSRSQIAAYAPRQLAESLSQMAAGGSGQLAKEIAKDQPAVRSRPPGPAMPHEQAAPAGNRRWSEAELKSPIDGLRADKPADVAATQPGSAGGAIGGTAPVISQAKAAMPQASCDCPATQPDKSELACNAPTADVAASQPAQLAAERFSGSTRQQGASEQAREDDWVGLVINIDAPATSNRAEGCERQAPTTQSQ